MNGIEGTRVVGLQSAGSRFQNQEFVLFFEDCIREFLEYGRAS